MKPFGVCARALLGDVQPVLFKPFMPTDCVADANDMMMDGYQWVQEDVCRAGIMLSSSPHPVILAACMVG